MDIFVFVIIIVAIGCGTGVITSYFEAKSKKLEASKINNSELTEIVAKLDKTISRVETLERLVVDNDQDLKRQINQL